MKIERYYADHEGLTKFYEILVGMNGNSAVLIQRWGPRGKFGQVKFSKVDAATAKSEALKVRNAKGNRGYQFDPLKVSAVDNDAQLRNWLINHHDNVHSAVYEPLAELIKMRAPDLMLPDPPKMVRPEPTRNEKWGSW